MANVSEALDLLMQAYGPQRWWPAATRAGRAGAWEVIVGAVLVQHTSWKQVVKAIAALEQAGAMSADAIHSAQVEQVALWVRSAGPPRVKAERLKAIARFLVDESGGSPERLLEGVTDRRVALAVRDRLLGVHGIGPETADAILLYAGHAPLFVVDAYKRRVMARHGWGDPEAKYDDVAQWWRRRLPRDASAYNEAHALLVRVGVEHCRKPTPRCQGCPLERMLPRSGPLAG